MKPESASEYTSIMNTKTVDGEQILDSLLEEAFQYGLYGELKESTDEIREIMDGVYDTDAVKSRENDPELKEKIEKMQAAFDELDKHINALTFVEWWENLNAAGKKLVKLLKSENLYSINIHECGAEFQNDCNEFMHIVAEKSETLKIRE